MLALGQAHLDAAVDEDVPTPSVDPLGTGEERSQGRLAGDQAQQLGGCRRRVGAAQDRQMAEGIDGADPDDVALVTHQGGPLRQLLGRRHRPTPIG